MPTTIKGPIVINKDNPLSEIVAKNTKVKLPFVATGWKSQYNSSLVESGGTLADVETPDKPKKKTTKKSTKKSTKRGKKKGGGK